MKNQQSKKEEWEIEFDKEFPRWIEPQPGAGEGLGPLAGTGMYMQYDADRKHRDEEVVKIKDFIRKSRQQLIDEVVSKMPKKMEKSDNHSFNMGGFGQRVEGYNKAIDDIITLLNNIKSSNK